MTEQFLNGVIQGSNNTLRSNGFLKNQTNQCFILHFIEEKYQQRKKNIFCVTIALQQNWNPVILTKYNFLPPFLASSPKLSLLCTTMYLTIVYYFLLRWCLTFWPFFVLWLVLKRTRIRTNNKSYWSFICSLFDTALI